VLKTFILTAAVLCFYAQQPVDTTVSLSMIVTDKDNKRVNNIRNDQIRVFEDKVEQTILSIEADSRPVDYGIVIDASGSFRTRFVLALDAVTLIIKKKRPADEVFIERFISNDKIERYHDFTTDADALIKSLDSFKIEGGQSAVIDALYTAVNYVAEHKSNEDRRKVVIIITDGEDRKSFYNQEALVKLLHETGVQVFALGVVGELDNQGAFTRPGARQKAEKLLKAVTEESGGRVLLLKDKDELIFSAAEIVLDLQAQFRIKYQSTRDPSTKGFRAVDVKFVPTGGEKLTLIVPKGYFIGPRPPKKQEKKP